MARPIKETPILYGEDARRFEEMISNVKPETRAVRERRMRNYDDFMKMLEIGENMDFPKIVKEDAD